MLCFLKLVRQCSKIRKFYHLLKPIIKSFLPIKVKMSNTLKPRCKKESPTENRRHFNTKRVGKSGDFEVKKPDILRNPRN